MQSDQAPFLRLPKGKSENEEAAAERHAEHRKQLYVPQPIPPFVKSSVKSGSMPPANAPLKPECHGSRGTRNRPTAKTIRKNKAQHPE